MGLIKVCWLVHEEERRNQEKRRKYGGFWEGKDEIVGEVKMRCSLQVLVGFLDCVLYSFNLLCY